MNQKITDFYNAHIAPGWFRSYALWTGIAAAILPSLPDWLQMALDSWASTSLILPSLSDGQREIMRIFLLLVILPIARAWQQKSIRIASLKQAVTNGEVVPSGVVNAPVQLVPRDEVLQPSTVSVAQSIKRQNADPGP